jgi:hypothetical protein
MCIEDEVGYDEECCDYGDEKCFELNEMAEESA